MCTGRKMRVIPDTAMVIDRDARVHNDVPAKLDFRLDDDPGEDDSSVTDLNAIVNPGGGMGEADPGKRTDLLPDFLAVEIITDRDQETVAFDAPGSSDRPVNSDSEKRLSPSIFVVVQDRGDLVSCCL